MLIYNWGKSLEILQKSKFVFFKIGSFSLYEAGKTFANNVERQGPYAFDMAYQLKCVFIYENRVIEGSVNQLKINRKY